MATHRDARVADVLVHLLDDLAPTGRWLVANDRAGRVRPALEAHADVDSWDRQAYGGASATAAPPHGPYDGVVLRLPRGHEAMRMVAHQACAQLAPEGRLVVAGANDEGIRPAPKRLLEVMQHTEVIDTRKHCRVVLGRSPQADLRGDLEDWRRDVTAEVADLRLTWRSWPSLFAHGRLDAGTRLLLESLPELEGRVLDFACGAGVITCFLQARGDSVQLEMSDVDALAAHAASRNAPGVPVHLADGLPVQGGPWDVLVSNPPLHLGKEGHRGVLDALAATAPHRLTRRGVMWLVVPGTVPVHRRLAAGFSDVERVTRDASYAIWRCAVGRPR